MNVTRPISTIAVSVTCLDLDLPFTIANGRAKMASTPNVVVQLPTCDRDAVVVVCVVTLAVKLLLAPFASVSDAGLMEHAALAGAPVQVRVIWPLNPGVPATDKLYVAV